jgi:hypothetical protein
MIAVGPDIGQTGIIVLPDLHPTYGARWAFEGHDGIEDLVQIDQRPR